MVVLVLKCIEFLKLAGASMGKGLEKSEEGGLEEINQLGL
jgi:hypothetical protein